MMTPHKPEIPYRAVAVVIALALAASIVSGRERGESAVSAPAAPLPPPHISEQIDFTTLKLARALDGAPEWLALTAEPLAARTVLRRDGDAAAPEPPRPDPSRAEPPRPAARRAAPPLPFTYLGQMLDEGRTTVFVQRGDDHYGLQPGLVIDDAYKVERITDTQVTFVYVPLGIRQVLTVPSLRAE
jgi:hypothetical protein